MCAKAGAEAIELVVKQALLRTVMPDGVVYQLVVLADNRCAILRDRACVHVASGDEPGIDEAVQRFTALTRANSDGGEVTPPQPGAEAGLAPPAAQQSLSPASGAPGTSA